MQSLRDAVLIKAGKELSSSEGVKQTKGAYRDTPSDFFLKIVAYFNFFIINLCTKQVLRRQKCVLKVLAYPMTEVYSWNKE